MPCNVKIINEVSDGVPDGEWSLRFHWAQYRYDDGSTQHGYRFMWRRPDGSLQAARGQARLPSLEQIALLIDKAKSAGWGNYDGDEVVVTDSIA